MCRAAKRWPAAIALLSIPFLMANPTVHIWEGKEMIVTAEQNLSITCEGPGQLRWTYPDSADDHVHTRHSGNKSILSIKRSKTDYTGLYSCSSKSLNNLSAEIYVYVSDENEPFVYSENTALRSTIGENLTIPCRVTHPDINVTLTQNSMPLLHPAVYDPKFGFLLVNVDYNYQGSYVCSANYKGKTDEMYFLSFIRATVTLPKPVIEGNKELRVRQGEDIHVSCEVKIEAHISHTINWTKANGQHIIEDDRVFVGKRYNHSRHNGQQYLIQNISLTILSARISDGGNYSCTIKSISQSMSEVVKVTVLERNVSYIEFKKNGATDAISVNDGTPFVKWAVGYEAVPQPVFKWFAPDQSEITSNAKYKIITNAVQTILNISSVAPSDAGIYTLVGEAGSVRKQHNFTLMVNALPKVTLVERHEFFVYSKSYNIKCKTDSYPLAVVKWYFFNCTGYRQCENSSEVIKQEQSDMNTYISNIALEAISPGRVQCQACNLLGCRSDNLTFLIADSEEGFSIKYPNVSVKGDNVILNCSVSKYNFAQNLTWWWRADNKSKLQPVTFHKGIIQISNFSIESSLHINNLSTKKHSGQYACKAWNIINFKENTKYIDLMITEKKPPVFLKGQDDSYMRYEGNEVFLDCAFEGIPKPEILWLKDGRVLPVEGNDTHTRFFKEKQILEITRTVIEDTGIFTCIINNSAGIKERNFNLQVTHLKAQSASPNSNSAGTVAAIVIVFIILLVAMVYLILRIMKERKHVNALSTQDIVHFHEGALLTIDPDLGVDEQADLLPYNKDYEFPREKLNFGKQLGCGAFGRVVKAEADGIKENEQFTTVAVKMVKPHSDISHLKALMTELKILIYIGHHLNVLNLLGACTTQLIKKELLVILEYCRFGNLHSYLQRHRESFTNQINPVTDEINFSIGQDATSEPIIEEICLDPSGAASNGSNVTFDTSTGQLLYSDSSGENSMLTMGENTGCSDVPAQIWNITYKSDFKGKLAAPLCTKDLLCWSYQVAMGMEYLSSLKNMCGDACMGLLKMTFQIVHADLATRNILLADNNIVKICDFGLARNLYKSADYKKKGQDPLPIKWMAVESIEDRIFSTKSDVWSFGIVLWEFFTLAKSPYPGLEVNEEFLKKLMQGYRMEKPEFSTHDMYRIMLSCWKAKPFDRPTFEELAHRIGEKLDAEVKQNYIKLSEPYVIQNSKLWNSPNDYLNVTQQNNSDYIQPETPTQGLYINVTTPESEQDKFKQFIFKKCDSTLSEGSDYLPMSK